MNTRLGPVAVVTLVALAGCGDSAIVERCIKEGQSAQTCRCADKIFRSELSGEEYRLMEEAAEGQEEAMAKALEDKGAGFALSFGRKMADSSMKIARECEGK